jgi:V8-like Glu-specific endopeptidase
LLATFAALSSLSSGLQPTHAAETRSVPAVVRTNRRAGSVSEAEFAAVPLQIHARQARSLESLPDALVTELKRQDVAEAKHRLRIGFGRAFDDPAVVNAATPASDWTVLPNRWKAWSLDVTSTGALGVRLHLQSLALPKGARLLVYDPAKPNTKRSPVTRETLHGETDLWTASVFGERVVLECQLPPGVDLKDVSFTVAELSHFYRAIQPKPRITTIDNPDVSCIPEVACYPDWATPASGVAVIQFNSGADTFLCTGCLLNDNQPLTFIDYFLTAHHCITGQSAASSIEFFWFDQTVSCDPNSAVSPAFTQVSGGADLLAGSAVSDFAFLRLREPTPTNVTYLGWSTAAPTANETLTTIEHPGGSTKKIAFGHQDSFDRDFWQIAWNTGVTEEGASGSPLLNSHQQVIGQLYGGFSTCSDPTGIDAFGRFDVTYLVIRRWIDNAPFAAEKGTYTGLFADTNGVSRESSGLFTVTITAKGTYSGNLQTAGRRYNLSGPLDRSTATANKTVLRPGQSSLAVAFGLDLTPGSDQITGTIAGGNWVAQLEAHRAVFDARTNAAPFAGNYTLVLPGTNVAGIPVGDGYGAVRVDASGRVRVTGSLPDGTAFTQLASVSQDGLWPFYASLNGGKASILGWLMFTNRTSDDLNGTVSWIKEAQLNTKFFSAGFTNSFIPATGSSYTPRIPVINLPQGDAIFTADDAVVFTNAVSVTSNNKVLNQSANSLTMNVALTTGVFNGNVAAPGATKRTPLKGVFLQKANAGYGYFLGNGQSGSVVVEAQGN